jgi:AAA+ ATPase superfamily predicted ATPase
MKFEREHYIEKLLSSKHNHLIKIVTGLRRVGKSYLLLNLYKQHLLDNGVDASWKSRLRLPPEGGVALTPENVFILTP